MERFYMIVRIQGIRTMLKYVSVPCHRSRKESSYLPLRSPPILLEWHIPPFEVPAPVGVAEVIPILSCAEVPLVESRLIVCIYEGAQLIDHPLMRHPMSTQNPVRRYSFQIIEPCLSDVREAPVYLWALAIFSLGICLSNGSRFGSGHVDNEVFRLISQLFT